MRKQRKSVLVLAMVMVFAAIWLFLPLLVIAGELNPPAGPDAPASAMYRLEDIYNYLDTGVAGTKREEGFVELTTEPGSTGYTLDEVHDKISERCITCEGELSDGGRWCDNLDGTVKDMATGLVWLKHAGCMGLMLWDDAIREPIVNLKNGDCDLTDGSVWGDWRLPTKDELSGIGQGTENVISANMHSFTNVQSHYYWVSTTHEDDSILAWYVDMDFYRVYYNVKGNSYYVWPVRPDN